MKIYVTKWAFSDGVRLMDAEPQGSMESSPWEGYMRVVRQVSYCPDFLRSGDWASTREEAEKQVEAMRAKKIAAAKRQIKQWQTFVVEWKEGE